MFKEHDSTNSLTYASNQVITLVQNLHVRMYRFLDANGHKLQLELLRFIFIRILIAHSVKYTNVIDQSLIKVLRF